MGDPEGAVTHTRNVIKQGHVDSSDRGTCMIVEPFAQNELENNVNPVASTFYANMCSQFISIQWTCTGSASRRKQNKRCSSFVA
jgi:hypothetical protein